MMKITVNELMKKQQKRLWQQEKQERSVTEDAKARFRRKPYYMKQDRCGNDLGGRD